MPGSLRAAPWLCAYCFLISSLRTVVTQTTAASYFPEALQHPCCIQCQNSGKSASYCLSTEQEQWYFLSNGQYAEETNYKNAWNKQETTVCRLCPTGWYRTQGVLLCRCVRCTTTVCSSNQYINPTCTPTSNQGCSDCSRCPIGQEVESSCTATTNTVCRACPAGTYRSTLEQPTCQACSVCSTQQRQRNTPCGGTSNNQCVVCPEGHIVTGGLLDTCSPCGTGTYARSSDNTCATCQTCARSHKQTRDCTAIGDRTCEACPFNRITSETNSVYCSRCRAGYFDTQGGSSNEPNCNECATSSCGTIGMYIVCTTSDQMGFRSCEWCEGHNNANSKKCTAGQGVSKACDGQGQEKVLCQDCPAGTERPDGTPLIDVGDSKLIQKCIACGLGKFKASAGTANCGACTNKPANSQYISWGPTTPSSNSCPWYALCWFFSCAGCC